MSYDSPYEISHNILDMKISYEFHVKFRMKFRMQLYS